ncbi:hypothetical protein ACEPAF_2375 [Sanghuangporus sanghuang]
MKHAILLNVPGLIGKRFPDKLFQSLRHPRGDITVVDGSDLLPHARPADVTSTLFTNDRHTSVEIGEAQHDSGPPLVLEQQAQATEATETVETGNLQNGGPEDNEVAPAEDSHVTSVSESPCFDTHPPNDLSRRSAPPSSTSSTESSTPEPSVEEIFKCLSKGPEPLYDVERKAWVDWPETSTQGKENEIAVYLNTILGRVRCFLYGTEEGQEDWIFTAEHAGKPIEDGRICRNKGLALVHRTCRSGFSWKDMRGLIEVKATESDLAKIGRSSCNHICKMYRANMSRRFVLLFSLVDTKMALFKYDRSGALVSEPFDVHEEPEQFLRVIVGMAFGEDYFLGLDPSFSSKDNKDYVMFDGTSFEIVRVIHLDAVIRSRGTVALLVKHPVTGKLLVIKDQWVDRDRKITEVDIFRKLGRTSLKVVRLIGALVVAFSVKNDSNILDSTEADREGVEESKKSDIEIRDHYRLLLSPYGDSIMDFRSLRELVSSFKDYAETIRDLYKTGFYHRDISYRNLIIAVDDDTSFRSGFLIDFDCATEISHIKSDEAELTGTLPFMPIEMLENNGCKHKYYFDLESLFYVLVWICLTEDGPRWKDHYPQSGYVFEGSTLDRWCGGDSIPKQDDNVAFKNIGNIKRAAMENVMLFHWDILNHLPVYFAHVKTLLKDLRKILFRPALDDEDDTNTPEDERPISKRKDVDRVFRRYIEALEKARDRLPASDPVPAPSSGVNGLSNHADANDHSVPLALEDKPERRARRALTTKRPTLVEDADDDDDKRKDPDYVDPGGYISPTAGKGRQSRATRSSLFTKRPAPDLGSSAKRQRTSSTRAKASRS